MSSLTSTLMNTGASSTVKRDGMVTGFLKLPNLPKDENLFGIWKLKVEAAIRGAGVIEILQFNQDELKVQALKKINLYLQDKVLEAKDSELRDLTQEQKDTLMNQSYKVYAALADTLNTADQMRILLNKKNVHSTKPRLSVLPPSQRYQRALPFYTLFQWGSLIR